MSWPISAWSGLILTLMVCPAFVVPRAEPPPSSTPGLVTLTGKAVFLTDVLKQSGVAFDPEPVSKQVVIQGKDGKITPLLCDDASRILFYEDRVRNRTVEVQGRTVAGSPFFRVVGVRLEENGVLRIPEYYCEVCAISVRSPQPCPCCQAEMEFRMKPDPR